MEKYTLGGYPDPFATQEEKLQKSYGINYFKRMYYDWVNDTNVTDDKAKRYERCRNYADGLQSVDKYKDIVGAEGDTSYLSLNWEVVPIIPKFVDVLMGGLINQEHKVKCSAIDPVSLDKRMQDKLDIQMNMAMREYNKKMAMITKLPFDKNQEQLPRDNDELELYMQLNYKQAVEIAMEQGIELSLYLNDWDEVRKRVIRDLITLNIGATKTGVDPNGITMRYVNPANLITSYSRHPDFKNITHKLFSNQFF